MDLIDRKALIKDVNENKELFESERVYLEGLLLNAPTIENPYIEGHIDGVLQGEKLYARPHGKWIEKIYTEKLGHGYLTHHDIVCSVCGNSGENDEGIPQNYKFCPNCGADMREDNDET